jgi:hypothetical protein
MILCHVPASCPAHCNINFLSYSLFCVSFCTSGSPYNSDCFPLFPRFFPLVCHCHHLISTMAWAVEEYKEILQAAYPRWYKGKSRKTREDIVQHVTELMKQANIARQKANKSQLVAPKTGFSCVSVCYLNLCSSLTDSVGNQELVFKCLKVCRERCTSR